MQDVVIVAATRTAIGSFQGSLANIPAPELGAAVIRRLLEQTGLDGAHVDEVILGHEALEMLDFLFGHEVAVGYDDACLSGDGIDGALVVTAEHDDFFNACVMEQSEGVGGFGAHGVADGEDAEYFALTAFMRGVAEYGEGLAFVFDLGEPGLDLG